MTQRSRPGEARRRVLHAALELFARHGVGGTSLQMIANEMGVTKAAVYHQFHTKDDIVRALITPALDRLTQLTDLAERKRTRTARAEAVLSGIVDLVVANRDLTGLLQSDPAILDMLRGTPEMQAIERRVFHLLAGPDPEPEMLVAAVMASGALMAAATGQRLDGFDDESLRRHLMANARRLLRLRNPREA
ncbi:TetR/AcrR family transcriptional regulator [Actinomadura barringtoniae]|uniref:TetR/AcrR family transcriptional regulator n=1 Tax=Actinomadura barringtoniae TaxID=1427535 RepID=A0A939T0W7_9ACTN|nr:TetR/AcrR family transcriptional regulator [Actinomadura barringtoniae]MBO2446331.1 TetR/AcrR family transcriptional regulator [Actinomadura barringtoniae]